MDLNECYDGLYKRVIKTRSSRIQSAERLNRCDRRYQIIQLVYAIFLTAISIWVFYCERTGRLVSGSDASTIILICSFTVTGAAFYVNSKNFKERALQLKTNYIALGTLLYDIEVTRCVTTEIDTLSGDFQKHYKKYSDLLEMVENHTTSDYLSVKMSNRETLNWYERKQYIGGILEDEVCPWVVLLSPLFFVLWLIYG